MAFLVWWDANKRRPAEEKAKEAIDTYRVKHSCSPAVMLVNAATHEALGNPVQLHGVAVEIMAIVADNTFYVGEHDAPPPPGASLTASEGTS